MSISAPGAADRPPDQSESCEPGGIAHPSNRETPTTATWRFTEDFHSDGEIAAQARHDGETFGASPVSRGAASILTLLARIIDARAVVELGSGAGVSGLALFAGMQSDGILTSIDIEPEHQHAARRAFESAGIAQRRFRLIAGDALTVLPKLSGDSYDLVLVDAEKLEYPSYLEQALRMLHSGGLLVIDNTLWHNRVADDNNIDDETEAIRTTVEAVRDDESLLSALLPVGDGLLVARKN